jgi:hypothetical protein
MNVANTRVLWLAAIGLVVACSSSDAQSPEAQDSDAGASGEASALAPEPSLPCPEGWICSADAGASSEGGASGAAPSPATASLGGESGEGGQGGAPGAWLDIPDGGAGDEEFVGRTTTISEPTCFENTLPCASDSACCSHYCAFPAESPVGVCAPAPAAGAPPFPGAAAVCGGYGANCQTVNDCCVGLCSPSTSKCTACDIGATCASNSDCCEGYCDNTGHQCQPCVEQVGDAYVNHCITGRL